MEDKFLKIKETVEKELSCSAHDMDHIMRVYSLCLSFSENEDVDLEVIKAAALLHDIARIKEDNDPTGSIDHSVLSAGMADPILRGLGFSEEKINHIKDCILSHRYRTGNKPRTKEAEILFDADKLDTLGAIGIARAFVWVGRNNAHIYKKADLKEYTKENLEGGSNGRIKDKSQHSPQIEFETKTKLLEEALYTEKGKELFEKRFNFYKSFLDRLEKEVKGEI